VAGSRKKYREPNEDITQFRDLKETCITFDKRVHRGNTYSQHVQNAMREALRDAALLEEQTFSPAKKTLRKPTRLKEPKIFDQPLPEPDRPPVDLTKHLVAAEESIVIQVETADTQTDEFLPEEPMFTCCCAADGTGGASEYAGIGTDEAHGSLMGVHASDKGKEPHKSGELKEFTAIMERERPTVPLGILLDPSGIQSLYVCSVQQDGQYPVRTANERAPLDKQLRAGDFIYLVNQVSGDVHKMMTEIQSSSRIEFLVRRPTVFAVSIDRKGAAVGCGITYDSCAGISLVIESINEGPVADWNASHPEKAVVVGDRVVSVNDCWGSAGQLLDAIRSSDRLTLQFVRAAVQGEL